MELKIGAKGKSVILLQEKLQKLGFYKGKVDGDFGHKTEKAVKDFQSKNNLLADGWAGAITLKKLKEQENNSTEISIDQILEHFKKNNYTIYTDNFRINLFALRMDDRFDNEFSDRLFVFWKNEKNAWELRSFPWTTMPGTLGYGGVYNPLSVMGVTGTAVLKEGQYINCWRLIWDYYGWLNYPYLMQCGNLTVLRDGNRDEQFDRYMPEQTASNFGINIHRMSNNGQMTRFVNTMPAAWSQGCQGSPEPVFKDILQLIYASYIWHGDFFTYTLSHLKDFK